MSHPNRLDAGRGRGAAAHRRVQVLPLIAVTRSEATAFWAGLVARRCGSREATAAMFGVTFQTACNWWDEFSCPTGDKVLQAMRWWPEDFAAGGGDRG